MTESRKDRIDRYQRYVTNATKTLAKLDRKTIEHLVRAREETAEIDGYGERSPGPSTAAPDIHPRRDDPLHAREASLVKSKGFGGKPVEAALLRMACPKCKGEGKVEGDTRRCKACDGSGERFTDDPLLYALEEIFTSLSELGGHAKIIDRKLPIVVEAAAKARSRHNEAGFCQGCHRRVERTSEDPMRGLYCTECSKRWYEWKKDFVAEDMPLAHRLFEEQRKKFDGHLSSACVVCIELEDLRKAS